MAQPDTLGDIEDLLARLKAGDAAARDQLILRSQARFHHLARRLLTGYPVVHPLRDTTDLLNDLNVKLLELPLDRINDARHLLRLACQIMRHHLQDLRAKVARTNATIQGDGSDTPLAVQAKDAGPATNAIWNEIHGWSQSLTAERGEVFECYFYLDMTEQQIADLRGDASRNAVRRILRELKDEFMQRFGKDFSSWQ